MCKSPLIWFWNLESPWRSAVLQIPNNGPESRFQFPHFICWKSAVKLERLVFLYSLKSRELWSSQQWTQFKQLRIEAWKSQDLNGVWTRDLAIPVRRSNQLSYEATDLGSRYFVSSNELREEWMWNDIWNISYIELRIWNQDFKSWFENQDFKSRFQMIYEMFHISLHIHSSRAH